MKTIAILTLVIAGLILGSPDSQAAMKRLSVGKKERLHELCEVSVCHPEVTAATASFQTTGVRGEAAPSDDRSGGFLFWLLALVVTGAFLLKEPFASASRPRALLQTQRCRG